jgi:hypothetical protein
MIGGSFYDELAGPMGTSRRKQADDYMEGNHPQPGGPPCSREEDEEDA